MMQFRIIGPDPVFMQQNLCVGPCSTMLFHKSFVNPIQTQKKGL